MSDPVTLDPRLTEALAALAELTEQTGAAVRTREALVARFDAQRHSRSTRSLTDATTLATAIRDADRRIAAGFAQMHRVLDVISAIESTYRE